MMPSRVALEMLDHESGRRAVLALTDGEDTFSQSATLDSVIATANRIGLPVYTLGLGTEEEIESNDLRRLAVSTRGPVLPGHVTPTSSARSTNRSPSGSMRVIRSCIRATARFPTARSGRCGSSIARSTKSAGETAVFIPGMVVPSGGWSPLFLGLLAHSRPGRSARCTRTSQRRPN